jgi:uncharacterized protein (TIGR02246 family)
LAQPFARAHSIVSSAVVEGRMKDRKFRGVQAWLACLLLVSACRGAASNPADEAMQVIQKWAAAFGESNVDAIVNLYAPDALFFGTGSKTLVSTSEQIRSYFSGLQKDRPRGAQLLEHSVRVVSDDVVIVTGMDQVSGTKDGSVYHAQGRVSFVLEKRGSAWQIVHFHRSTVPTS